MHDKKCRYCGAIATHVYHTKNDYEMAHLGDSDIYLCCEHQIEGSTMMINTVIIDKGVKQNIFRVGNA